ncbi:hypothetical protein [Kitasatospora sp. NPDC093558]|uniref:hypothetical protein n=1 Tax=Kitasatospora sp. NPDC093558 TaxID=3155201 RepID=UPI00341A5CD9
MLATLTTAAAWLVVLLLVIGIGAAGLVILFTLAILVASLWLAVRIWTYRLLGDAVKVTPESFPGVYRAIGEVRRELDYRKKIDVYVSNDVPGKARLTNLLGHRVVILDGGFVSELRQEDYARVRFVIGSFIGYLKVRAARYDLLIYLLDQVYSTKILGPLMNPYYRATVYSGDQIGYWCSGSLDAALSVLARYLTGKELGPELSVSGVLEQAVLVQSHVLVRLSQLSLSRPYLINRYVNVIAFAACMNPAEYERFQGGLDAEARRMLHILLSESPHRKLPIGADRGVPLS